MDLIIPKSNTDGRRLYFGFKVTESWLIEYAKEEFRKYDPANMPISKLLLLYEATLQLQHNSGVRKVRLKPVLPLPTSTPVHLPDHLPKDGSCIIAICSSGPNWFRRRLTQAQADALKGIVGGEEPCWWDLGV
jgi:hypothetical protein